MPSDIAAIIHTALSPLTSEIQSLKDKVDRLSQDRVTRTDIENLRKELIGTMVPRDAYEPRHASLIERDTQLEFAMREHRKETDEEIKELKNQIEMNKRLTDDKFEKKETAELSRSDRTWLRISQLLGFVAVLIAILDWLFQHVHLG